MYRITVMHEDFGRIYLPEDWVDVSGKKIRPERQGYVAPPISQSESEQVISLSPNPRLDLILTYF